MCLSHRCIGVNTPSPTHTDLHSTVNTGVNFSPYAAMNTCDTFMSAAGTTGVIKMIFFIYVIMCYDIKKEEFTGI